MLIAEELMLLLLDRPTGELPRRKGAQTALAAAVLIEVATTGRLGIDPPTVTIEDDTPLDDPLLDEVKTEGTVEDLIRATVPDLYRRLLDSMTEQDVLTRTNRWWTLGVVSKTVWRPTDPTHRDQILTDLRTVLFGRSEPDQRTGTLITLAHALDILDTENDEATGRAEEISEGHWAANEVTKAIVVASKENVATWAMAGDFILGLDGPG